MSKGYGRMILLLQLIPIAGAILFAGWMTVELALYFWNGTELSGSWGEFAMIGWLLSALGIGTGGMGLVKTIGNNGEGLSKRMRRAIIILSWISLIAGVLSVGFFICMICSIHV